MKIDLIFLGLLTSSGLALATTQTAANQDKPARLYIKSFSGMHFENRNISNTFYTYPNSPNLQIASLADNFGYSDNMLYQDWESGTFYQHFDETYLTVDSGTTVSSFTVNEIATLPWLPSAWPNVLGSYTGVKTVNTSVPTPPTVNGYQEDFGYISPPISEEHCSFNMSWNSARYVVGDFNNTDAELKDSGNVSRFTQATIKLQTGGKATSNKRHLFRFTGGAVHQNYVLQPDSSETSYIGNYKGWSIESYDSVAPENTFIGSFGNLNQNGVLHQSLPDNVDVDVTPFVAGVDYYSFGLNAAKIITKADWKQVVMDEMDADSGVQIENYLAGNGFMTNRLNIQAVYAFYQKVFDEQPTWYYWTGLAKLAGAPVYAGLSDAEYCRIGAITSGYLTLDNLGATIATALLESKATQFQNDLIGMNIAIYEDLGWQFEAYRKCGLNAIQQAYAIDNTVLNPAAINAWGEIDGGIQRGNLALIQQGNQDLLQREQQQILAQGYSDLSSLFPGTTSLMSIFAQNPVIGGPSFSSLEPSGNIANFNDRWDWITHPYISVSNAGMLPLWLHESSSTRLADVGQQLLYRAQSDFSLVYEYFGFPIY